MATTAVRPRRAGRRSPSVAGAAAGWLRARWRRAAVRPDAGAVTAEVVLVTPLLLFMFLLCIQVGVWFHASHVAQAAATRAASAAAAYRSSAAAGQTAGVQTLAAIGSGVVKSPAVSVTRTATEVRVEVTGTAASVIPGVHWTVRAVVVKPVERFVPDLTTAGGSP